MKAFGYARVSTEGQAVDGVSLDAQRAKIEAWCTAHGYDLVTTFEDAGISGGRADNRPGLQDAMDAACGEGAALVTYSLSRLARSTQFIGATSPARRSNAARTHARARPWSFLR